jgi:hypothetical protein
MSLALLIGLRIYKDKVVLEPWFNLNNFEIRWTKNGDWCD